MPRLDTKTMNNVAIYTLELGRLCSCVMEHYRLSFNTECLAGPYLFSSTSRFRIRYGVQITIPIPLTTTNITVLSVISLTIVTNKVNTKKLHLFLRPISIFFLSLEPALCKI